VPVAANSFALLGFALACGWIAANKFLKKNSISSIILEQFSRTALSAQCANASQPLPFFPANTV
jgi:hypothetical protein